MNFDNNISYLLYIFIFTAFEKMFALYENVIFLQKKINYIFF